MRPADKPELAKTIAAVADGLRKVSIDKGNFPKCCTCHYSRTSSFTDL